MKCPTAKNPRTVEIAETHLIGAPAVHEVDAELGRLVDFFFLHIYCLFTCADWRPRCPRGRYRAACLIEAYIIEAYSLSGHINILYDL